MFVRRAAGLVRRGFHSSALRRAEEAAKGAAATKVNLNFQVPHDNIYEDVKVDMVVLPGAAGTYGVTAGHVPVISELKPGVVEIHHEKDTEIEKFFISGGFAFTHSNSNTELACVEAVKVEDLDETAAKDGLNSYRDAMAQCQEGTVEHAEARIGFEVHQAMCSALGVGQ